MKKVNSDTEQPINIENIFTEKVRKRASILGESFTCNSEPEFVSTKIIQLFLNKLKIYMWDFMFFDVRVFNCHSKDIDYFTLIYSEMLHIKPELKKRSGNVDSKFESDYLIFQPLSDYMSFLSNYPVDQKALYSCFSSTQNQVYALFCMGLIIASNFEESIKINTENKTENDLFYLYFYKLSDLYFLVFDAITEEVCGDYIREKHSSNLSSIANKARHANSNKTRLFAITLFKSERLKESNNKRQSVRKIAKKILAEVIAYGAEHGFNFTSDHFQALETIYKWLLEEEKKGQKGSQSKEYEFQYKELQQRLHKLRKI